MTAKVTCPHCAKEINKYSERGNIQATKCPYCTGEFEYTEGSPIIPGNKASIIKYFIIMVSLGNGITAIADGHGIFWIILMFIAGAPVGALLGWFFSSNVEEIRKK
jgi:hypothetical protein